MSVLARVRRTCHMWTMSDTPVHMRYCDGSPNLPEVPRWLKYIAMRNSADFAKHVCQALAMEGLPALEIPLWLAYNNAAPCECGNVHLSSSDSPCRDVRNRLMWGAKSPKA